MSLTINSYTQKPHTHSSLYTFSFSTYAESLIKRCVDFRERKPIDAEWNWLNKAAKNKKY